MIFVMMEAEPNDVGYDLFVFCMRFVPDKEPDSVAICALSSRGRFFLLATAPNCPADAPKYIKWDID